MRVEEKEKVEQNRVVIVGKLVAFIGELSANSSGRIWYWLKSLGVGYFGMN